MHDKMMRHVKRTRLKSSRVKRPMVTSARQAKRPKVALAPCEFKLTSGPNKTKPCGSTSNCRHRKTAVTVEAPDPLQLALDFTVQMKPSELANVEEMDADFAAAFDQLVQEAQPMEVKEDVAEVPGKAEVAEAETEVAATYCRVPKKDGRPCQFETSARPCPVHVKSEPTAEDVAKEAARLALPPCPMTTRSGKLCGARGCPYHAPPGLRCASMLDGDPKLQCFSFKDLGEFCVSHEAFPNLSVNMVAMLQLTPGEIMEDDFRAKYYPGNVTSLCFEFTAYVKLMRVLVN